MQVQLTEPDLAAIVETAVSMMIEVDLGEQSDGVPQSYALGATVQFTGDWSGAIVVGCDEDFGRETAAAMFASDTRSVSPDDVFDALGELANMIAGNVKPLLPGTTSISLPTVAQGAALQLGVPGAVPWVGVAFRRGDSVLSVQIFERAAGEA